MILTFVETASLAANGQAIQVGHEQDNKLLQYYMEKDRTYNQVSSPNKGDYSALTFKPLTNRTPVKSFSKFGIKTFPKIGAYGWFRNKYGQGTQVLFPLSKPQTLYEPPTFSYAQTANTVKITIVPPASVIYECYRVIFRLGHFATEYITYDTLLEVPKPDSGTYDLSVIGYRDTGETSEETTAQPIVVVNPAPLPGPSVTSLSIEAAPQLTGNVVMAAGANVTLNQDTATKKITISASGDGGGGSMITWRGEWNAAITYAKDDAVSYEGSSYVSSEASNIGNEPGVATQWTLIAQGASSLGSSFPLDTVPDLPSFYDDEFNEPGPELDARWSWLNQGTATYDFSVPGFLRLFRPSATVNLRALVQDRPVGNFSVRAKFARDGYSRSASEKYVGVVVVNSSTGAHVTAGCRDTGNLLTMGQTKYTNLTGSGASDYAMYKMCSAYYWVRVDVIGTNCTMYYSNNGVDWGEPSVTIAAPTSFDKIGVGIQIGNGSDPVNAWFDWFRVVTL